jgi:hypothetical protein
MWWPDAMTKPFCEVYVKDVASQKSWREKTVDCFNFRSPLFKFGPSKFTMLSLCGGLLCLPSSTIIDLRFSNLHLELKITHQTLFTLKKSLKLPH